MLAARQLDPVNRALSLAAVARHAPASLAPEFLREALSSVRQIERHANKPSIPFEALKYLVPFVVVDPALLDDCID